MPCGTVFYDAVTIRELEQDWLLWTPSVNGPMKNMLG